MALRLLVIACSVSLAFGLTNFWYNVHDGQNRIQSLSEADLGSSLAEKPLAVVWVRTNPGEDKIIEKVTEEMLQHSAQYLEQQGGLFGSLAIPADSTFAADYGLESNMVLVFKNGQQITYHGYRSAQVFTSFIEKLGDSAVSIIDSKATKKVFDRIQTTKVVGYFAPRDSAQSDFEAAAAEFRGDVPFFMVQDPVVAQKLKLNVSGEIHVHQPFDKQRYPVPQVPATIDDIRIFLYDHSRPVLRRLTMENIHSLWENVNENINNVISFSSRYQPEGPPFYKILKTVSRSLVNETALQVTVIETDQFPMVLPHWEALYKINLTTPALGLVNLTDNNSTWFDIPSMQLLVNETDKQGALTQWFTEIIQGVVRVDGLEPAVPEPPVEEPGVEAEASPDSVPATEDTQSTEGQGQGQTDCQDQGQVEDAPAADAQDTKTEL